MSRMPVRIRQRRQSVRTGTDMEPQQTRAHIDPDDFLDSKPIVKSDKPGRKPTTRCKKGHLYAKAGRKRTMEDAMPGYAREDEAGEIPQEEGAGVPR